MEVAEISQMATSHELTEASHQKEVQVWNLSSTHPPLPMQLVLEFSCQTLGLH